MAEALRIGSRALGFLGLAMRAGKVHAGEGAALECVRAGEAGVLLLDDGASANTRKRFLDACSFRPCPVAFAEQGALGQSIGRPGRMAAAVEKGPFSGHLLRQLQGQAQSVP